MKAVIIHAYLQKQMTFSLPQKNTKVGLIYIRI